MVNATFSWKVDPEKSLANLSSGIRNKALRIAINAGAAPVKAAVIASAPKDTGNLAASTKIRVRNYKANNTWVAIVGAGSSFKRAMKTKDAKGRGKIVKKIDKKTGKMVTRYHRPALYQKFVDQGTVHAHGRHYLTAAFQRARSQFVDNCRRKLKEVIEQLMLKK